MTINLEQYQSLRFYNDYGELECRISNYEKETMMVDVENYGTEYNAKITNEKATISIWATKIVITNSDNKEIGTLEI